MAVINCFKHQLKGCSHICFHISKAITTKSNESFIVEVEHGKPIFGFQNVILLVCGLNNKVERELNKSIKNLNVAGFIKKK